MVAAPGISADVPQGVLCAGGTLRVRPLTPTFCVLLVVEMALIFVGAPLAVSAAVHDYRVPVFIALMPALAIALVFLLADPAFSMRRELTRGFGLTTLLSILGGFAVGGGAVAYYVAHVHPDWFLEFPRNRPATYQRIMLLYPAMSVVVQELVYRTFFFHRYGALFGRAWWLAILVNGVLFGLGHIVIGTELAVYGTMATGTLFAWRYVATRSFWAVFIEHTLWGALVFTVGLGRFFFAGVGILSWR
jgi:membrane protease YdiL (CAAX protease family)